MSESEKTVTEPEDQSMSRLLDALCGRLEKAGVEDSNIRLEVSNIFQEFYLEERIRVEEEGRKESPKRTGSPR